jgi:hypothetical protein
VNHSEEIEFWKNSLSALNQMQIQISAIALLITELVTIDAHTIIQLHILGESGLKTADYLDRLTVSVETQDSPRSKYFPN